MGCKYNWENAERIERKSDHCQTNVTEPLIHYIIDCPIREQNRGKIQQLPYQRPLYLPISLDIGRIRTPVWEYLVHPLRDKATKLKKKMI